MNRLEESGDDSSKRLKCPIKKWVAQKSSLKTAKYDIRVRMNTQFLAKNQVIKIRFFDEVRTSSCALFLLAHTARFCRC